MTDARPFGPGSLDALRDLGPFFVVRTHGEGPPPAPWSPVTDLLADLAPRVEQVRAYLASGVGPDPSGVELRVAASVMHLGLVARLVSPWVGLAARDGILLPVGVDDLWWIPSLGGGFELSVASRALDRARPGPLDAWAVELVRDLLAPLVDAVQGSPSVLWGNTASAVNGAVIAGSATHPELSARLRTVADALLAGLPGPGGAGVHTGRVGTSGFRRRSCCLIYRVGGDARPRAVCGDCILPMS
ncbi:MULTISPECIES: (2Fe-2S)-binding protein [unclassified Allobranchiibius]|uniref:(2Fe-2S)-binding protein n=1 Tax=unclassified Allobranchiibius TaxID=2649857 RepID=UPI001AA155C1|nr:MULTISPECIES: (2Fe-2S)-binding protein [unclassified Allobranchiibius]MBO1767116.1 (2Fe-2S)-binding protein [Allobranchiibius sp. GilTou38]UIJ35892.1 (2Fe-2S)-binding protein [Allobranchiibius sp. GilTou73]